MFNPAAMRSLLFLFAVLLAISLPVSAEESGEEQIALTPWAELIAPSEEYSYSIPKPGSYDLPAVKMAVNGTVLGTNGAPVRLFDLMKDRIVVLSFIYTRCGDPRACIKATGVLRKLQEMSQHDPSVASKLLLLTFSFDPAYDTPEVMSRYGRISISEDQAADWFFLTTQNEEDLRPLLEAYGQRIDKRTKPSALGPISHNLRVFLIDPQRRVRNIYSYGLLDPRLVFTDVQSLFLEQGQAE